jgi:hypothetical protein
MLQRKQNRTFANYFQIFLRVRNVFVCFKLLRNQNRTSVFSKNYIKTKLKRYKLCQGFLKTKQNFLLFQKKFGNGPEQKLLDKIFLVLIENVLFRSRIFFKKRLHSIFFGTKAAKRKLPILKDRWFDIARSHLHANRFLWTSKLYSRAPKKFYCFSAALKYSFSNLKKSIWAIKMDQKVSRVYTVNQKETTRTAKKFSGDLVNKCKFSNMLSLKTVWEWQWRHLIRGPFEHPKTRREFYVLLELSLIKCAFPQVHSYKQKSP